MKNHSRLLFIGTNQDQPFLQRLKPCIGTASCAVVLETPSTFTELKYLAAAKHATAIISTSPSLLLKCTEYMGKSSKKKPAIDNYAGSLFSINGLEILFIDPLEQLVTVSYGKFLTSRYISKLIASEKWFNTSKFKWELFNEATFPSYLQAANDAIAIACDIETFSTPPSIRCVGFTIIARDYTTSSLVIPCNSMYSLTCIRSLLDTSAPKIFQNGKYDISYLQAYNSAPINYLWDTAEMFHSWYSELPKDLASLNAFFVRDAQYWKDLADTSDLMQYYMYNAKDTWATAMVFLAWIAEAPQWAKNNYANTFPLQFPCHLSEMTGIARDMTALEAAKQKQDESISSLSKSLDRMLGVSGFNVNSAPQMKSLLKVLGCGDLESADAKNLHKAKLRHPLNARIINQILEVRKARKLVSTYLTPGKEFCYERAITGKSEKRGRILYSLNPHGTDTGRLASKEHHFWCGLQVQNIPRGTVVKRTLVADSGFKIAECDLEQAESRDTAHIAGDTNLIAAVSGTRDFHSLNASAFFGIPYDNIYDDGKGKTRDKSLRDLAKRVNHGANYNMGAMVLIDTMGEDKIWEAKRLLKLPRLYSSKQVAEHLLAQFHRTYPAISKIYYPGVIEEIALTHMLSSKAVHHVPYQTSPQALVRYCFGDPKKNKLDLNAYVAHPPQSLNAMTLNRAYMRVFYEIALPNPKDFKLLAQIHDSILFQFRDGRLDLAEKVKEAMEIPVTVIGYDKVERTFTVPAALKIGADGTGATSWGDTE